LIRILKLGEEPEYERVLRSNFERSKGDMACAGFYRPYLRRLIDAGFQGNLIIHGLNEDEVELRTAFLRTTLASLSKQG
jgi:hypothetical protein